MALARFLTGRFQVFDYQGYASRPSIPVDPSYRLLGRLTKPFTISNPVIRYTALAINRVAHNCRLVPRLLIQLLSVA